MKILPLVTLLCAMAASASAQNPVPAAKDPDSEFYASIAEASRRRLAR